MHWIIRNKIDIILLDFAKAFDTVPHQRLLTKLQHYGIRSNTYNWIKAWLNHLMQQVVLTSSSESVTSSVLQGIVLGPLMFLLYINNIITNVNSPLRIFADDCLLNRIIDIPEDTAILQNDLDQIINGYQLGNLL